MIRTWKNEWAAGHGARHIRLGKRTELMLIWGKREGRETPHIGLGLARLRGYAWRTRYVFLSAAVPFFHQVGWL